MKQFDDMIFDLAKKEQQPIPEHTAQRIEEVLSNLPPRKEKVVRFRIMPRVAAVAASLALALLVVMPNVSVAYAEALSDVPVIGAIVKVVTIRNYNYADGYHDMNVEVPNVDDASLGDAGAAINKDVDALTEELVNRFYADAEAIGEEGHTSLSVDYEVLTETDNWFTLKLTVFNATGSGMVTYHYYNVDRSTNEVINLGQLFSDSNYSEVLRQDILAQMKQRMADDPSLVYWTEDSDMGQDFIELGAEHNFYFDANGNLVIPFDEYEVAPGYMGTPEFTIDASVFSALLNPQYQNLFA